MRRLMLGLSLRIDRLSGSIAMRIGFIIGILFSAVVVWVVGSVLR